MAGFGAVALVFPWWRAVAVACSWQEGRSRSTQRLTKELAKAEKDLAGVERTLANEGFVAKAAPEVVEKKRAQAAELAATIEQLKAQIADFA